MIKTGYDCGRGYLVIVKSLPRQPLCVSVTLPNLLVKYSLKQSDEGMALNMSVRPGHLINYQIAGHLVQACEAAVTLVNHSNPNTRGIAKALARSTDEV